MKKCIFLVLHVILCCSIVFADNINGDKTRQSISLSSTHVPQPHLIDIVEPVAMYTVSTEVIDITFDSNYYSQYTVYLSG